MNTTITVPPSHEFIKSIDKHIELGVKALRDAETALQHKAGGLSLILQFGYIHLGLIEAVNRAHENILNLRAIKHASECGCSINIGSDYMYLVKDLTAPSSSLPPASEAAPSAKPDSPPASSG